MPTMTTPRRTRAWVTLACALAVLVWLGHGPLVSTGGHGQGPGGAVVHTWSSAASDADAAPLADAAPHEPGAAHDGHPRDAHGHEVLVVPARPASAHDAPDSPGTGLAAAVPTLYAHAVNIARPAACTRGDPRSHAPTLHQLCVSRT